jgi:hypothetical protein
MKAQNGDAMPLLPRFQEGGERFCPETQGLKRAKEAL